MNVQEFAATVRAKHPGAYEDMDDATLTQKVLAKYPQYQDMVDTSSDKPGALESGALGLMSGVPGAETAVSGLESTFTPKTYAEAHQGLEQAKDQAWESHPVAYGAGKVGGMVGTGIVAPEVEGLAGATALGASIGALSGADTAATPSDIPGAALKAAPVGAVTGLAGRAVSKALSPAVAKSALASMGTKTTTEDIQNYLNNPEAIRNALIQPELGTKLADVTSGISNQSKQLSEQARNLLDSDNSVLTAPPPTAAPELTGLLDANGQEITKTTLPSISLPNTIKPLFDQAKLKYLTSGVTATPADQTAIGALNDQYARLVKIANNNDGQIPETVLRDVIDRLQVATKDSTFGNPEAGASQTALKNVSGMLNDQLREANPDYAEQMAPSAKLAGLSSDLKSHFGIEPNAEGNLAPTDKTATRISNAMNDAKPEGADLLDRIKNATGQDLQQVLADARTKANFEAPGAGGGLRALLPALGYGVGRMTGVPFGGIAGAGVGHYAAGAMNGGNIAKGILDMYLKGSKTGVGQIAQKFGPVLANAAKAGGTQLAATHFVLATSNPEYQTLVDHVQNNNQ